VKLYLDLVRGLWKENPTFRMLIGMCPTLAITNAAMNGIAMGLATTFVLVCSSMLVSLLKNVIPSKVRIPCYVIIIATFVTIADLVLAAWFPEMYEVLGLFIPLIVVNCIILARAEAFASKNSIVNSAADALGMGLGFTWAITLLSIIREILGMGSLFGLPIMGQWFTPILIFILPPGAFITLGVLLGIINFLTSKKSSETA
jgi:electron transport complex protein RnfE